MWPDGQTTVSDELNYLDGLNGLEVQRHLTGEGRSRLDMGETLTSIRSAALKDRMWVYISGPKGFIEAGKNACEVVGVEFFAAGWD